MGWEPGIGPVYWSRETNPSSTPTPSQSASQTRIVTINTGHSPGPGSEKGETDLSAILGLGYRREVYEMREDALVGKETVLEGEAQELIALTEEYEQEIREVKKREDHAMALRKTVMHAHAVNGS